MSKMGLYSFFEDKWYQGVEALHITRLTDRIDSHVPSFLVFLLIIFILLISFIFLLSGPILGMRTTYDVELTVVSKIGLPIEGASVSLQGDCGDDYEEFLATTDKDGKVNLEVCSTTQNIRLEKTGYKIYQNEIDIDVDKIFKLSPLPPQIKTLTVLVKDEQNQLLPNANLTFVCDGNTTSYNNQSQSGFFVEVSPSCSLTQLRAKAPGYKEKTKTLNDSEERIILKLEEEILEGKIIFETKTPTTEEANVEIRITDSANKSFSEITDSSGVKDVTLPVGEYSYSAISQKGEVLNGTFVVLSNSTENETILFSDIIVEVKKAIYVKIVSENDSPVIGAKVSFYRDEIGLSSRNTNSSGETSPIAINPDLVPEGTIHTAIIKAPGYETKFSNIEIVDRSGEPQKIIIRAGGATLKVKHIDDLNINVKDAYTTLYYKGLNEVFDSGTSDKNGEVLFRNLPSGEYTLKSTYSKTDSYGELVTTVSQDSNGTITIVLITGEGKMKFNFKNQTGTDIDTNYEFYESIDGMLQKSVTGETTRNYYYSEKIKSRTNVKLKTTNSEYFPHETIVYKMSRANQNKDVFLRELNTLPNSEEVQMFLVGMYSSNPLTDSFDSTSKIEPGDTYYLYFDIILNNEASDYLVGNFKIGDGDTLTESISIENIFSIEGYSRVMTQNSNSFIIDTTRTDLVDVNAKQANLILQNQQGKKSIPVFVEIKVDENAIAESSIPFYFQTTHGTVESLLYTNNLVIGESVCLFEYDSDCPAFLLSHYLKWNENDYIPLEDNHLVLIGDDYTIKTTVKNLTDEELGTVDLKLSVPKEKISYYTIGNDTNTVTHQVNLIPLSTSSAKETGINLIKKTNSGKINLYVEKFENGIGTLSDYELNEDQIRLKIVEKEELDIAIIPNEIHQNVNYPHFFIKTKYKSQYKGTSAIWYVEKNGTRLGAGYEGITDENGEENTSFDTTNLDEGDVLTFVAYDLNGNVPVRMDIVVRDPFPPAPVIAPSCLKLKLPDGTFAADFDIPYFEINESGIAHIYVKSECADARTAYIYTDLYVSENNFTLAAGEEKDITITGTIRDDIYGAYPLQLLEIGSTQYTLIEHIDVVVNNNGCLKLGNAVLDFKLTNDVSTQVVNSCFSGRKDNYYPNLTLNTNSVAIKYNKPGNPETYTFNAKVLGHGLESIAYGFIKSDVMSVSETAGLGNDPYDTPTLATVAKVTDTAADICEDVVYTGISVPKPEPDLPETTPDPTNTYTPSSVVPITGNVGDVIIQDTATTKAKEMIDKILFTGTTITSVGTGRNATLSETSTVLEGGIEGDYAEDETCTSMNNYLGEGGIRGVNCGPYHPGYPDYSASGFLYEYYYMEYIWDVMHDVQGNPTPGSPRPTDYAKYWGAVRDLRGQDYTVIGVNADRTAKITKLSYAGDGITYAKYYVKGRRESRNWGMDHDNKTSYLKTQVDYTRVVEWASDQIAVWEAEVTVTPVEGAVYDVGAYDAQPVPLWTLEDTVHGYEADESWNPEGTKSLYTVACVVNNGFVDPERMSSLESSEPWIIRDPAEPYIEYSGSGNIMYEIPADSVPPELRVYLRNGHYFAEYVGVPEIASPTISIDFSNSNLQGSEYAILKVRDWVGTNIKETAFQVKLVGNEHNCYSNAGLEGVTGSQFAPKLLFDWDWNTISYDQCDSENPNYTYCDGLQFNISLMKRLNEIEQLLLQGNIDEIPTKTAFYAHLIRDNYSQDLLDDFVETYSSDFLNAGTTFNKFKKFIEENKLNYEVKLESGESGTLLPQGGLYRVEIDIDRINENLFSLFNENNVNANISIVLRPIDRASNYNPFYDTPFDGSIGSQRNGYGASIDVNGLKLNNSLVANNGGNSALQIVNYETSQTPELLSEEIVLRYDGNSKVLQFYPAQPTPVHATIIGSSGLVKAEYKVEGSFADSLPSQEWKLVNSTIGGVKCHDFENNEVAFVNETITGTTHKLRWNGIRSGTLGLTTTMFTPKNPSDTLRITPTLGSLIFNSQAGLINSDAIMLQNYDQQGIGKYDTLKGIFEMVSEEKLCISKYSDSKIEIFWNPEYLNELTDSVSTGNNC